MTAGNRKLRILITIDDLAIGGSQTYALTYAKYLARKGHYVVVAEVGTPWLTKAVQTEKFKVPENVGHRDFVFRSPLEAFPRMMSLISYAKEEEFDVINANNGYSLYIAPLISWMSQTPLVCTVHQVFAAIDNRYLRVLQGKFHRIIAVSKEVREYLMDPLGIPQDKIRVVPNSVDLETFGQDSCMPHQQVPPDKTSHSEIILFVSRLDPDKVNACKAAIDAIPGIAETRPNARMIVLGDGLCRHELDVNAARINDAFGDDKVTIVGGTTRPIDFYRDARIVIGAGRVAVEAMALGKPTILLSNRSFGGVMEPGIMDRVSYFNFSGRHSKTKPCAEYVSRAVLELLSSDERIATLSAFSANYVKNALDANTIVDLAVEAYLEAIEVGRR